MATKTLACLLFLACTPVFSELIFTSKSSKHLAGCQNEKPHKDLCFEASEKGGSVYFKNDGKILMSAHVDDEGVITRSYGEDDYQVGKDDQEIKLSKEKKNNGNAKKASSNDIKESIKGIIKKNYIKLATELLEEIQRVPGIIKHREALLPLYSMIKMLGQAESKLLKRKQRSVDYQSMSTKRYLENVLSRNRRNGNQCAIDETPNVDQDCHGMCGIGCDCWMFVCGDCCIHNGCKMHDNCCRQNFYAWKCLFPTGMTCEYYHRGRNCPNAYP